MPWASVVVGVVIEADLMKARFGGRRTAQLELIDADGVAFAMKAAALEHPATVG